MKKIEYSKTINSLRGISVIGVLLYHSKFEFFKYGFLGVDIFFVISGYLIGNIIFYKLENKEFKFSLFYIKRIRRLLPAILFTIIFTYILCYFVFLPEDFNSIKDSIIYVLTFTSNIYFWKTSDYFSPNIDILPLSHLWSLGLEEQFYLIFPIVIYLIYKFKNYKKILLYIILIWLTLSFTYSSFNFYHLPFDCSMENCIEVTNFYWLHTRFWEFLVGTLLNFVTIKSKYYATLLFIGVVFLIVSLFLIDSNLSHPGLGTIPIILSTAIIIYSSQYKKVNYLSESKILNFFGKISYSLYLIHFPLFAIKNYLDLKIILFKTYDVLPLIIILLSIFLSFVMWKYIEEPFRNRNIIHDKKFFFIIVFLIFIILLFLSPLVPTKKLNDDIENFEYSIDFQIKRNCFFESIPKNISDVEKCLIPEVNKTNILIIGSSLAQNIYKGFENNNNPELKVNYIAITGCPPFLNYKNLHVSNFNELKCEKLYGKVLEGLKYYKDDYFKIIVIYNWDEITNKNSRFNSRSAVEIFNNLTLNFETERLLVLGQPVVWKTPLKLFLLRELNFKNYVLEYSNNNLETEIFKSDEIMKSISSEFNISYLSLIDINCFNQKCRVFEVFNGKKYLSSADTQHISDHFSNNLSKIIENIIFNQS